MHTLMNVADAAGYNWPSSELADGETSSVRIAAADERQHETFEQFMYAAAGFCIAVVS